MRKEVWKDIEQFDNQYQISNIGRIRSKHKLITKSNGSTYTRRAKILKPSISKDGYVKGAISLMNKMFPYTIHRLVAIAFIPNPSNKSEVNHINGVKTDNQVCNLEWCTRSENCKHAIDTGLWEVKVGDKNGMSKLTKEQVIHARKLKAEKGRFWGRNELAKEWGISPKHLQKVVNNPKTSWYNV